MTGPSVAGKALRKYVLIGLPELRVRMTAVTGLAVSVSYGKEYYSSARS
jgi:hypothetical protein